MKLIMERVICWRIPRLWLIAHGSWLNLIEGFFSKFARSVLRHIRVTSKHELKQRIMAGIDDAATWTRTAESSNALTFHWA
jgi:hypothetical protein